MNIRIWLWKSFTTAIKSTEPVKLKKACEDQGINLTRRWIGYIMEKEGLVSLYTAAQFKPQNKVFTADK